MQTAPNIDHTSLCYRYVGWGGFCNSLNCWIRNQFVSGVASGSAMGAVGSGVVGSDAFLGLVGFTLGLAGVVEG